MSDNKPANYWEAYKLLGKKLVVKRFSRIPFISFCKDYTQVNAYNLALFSILAYADRNTITQFFKQLGNKKERKFNYSDGKINGSPFIISTDFENNFRIGDRDVFDEAETNPKGDTQFFISRNKRQILISIRGTEPTEYKDWLKDANAKEVDFKEGKGQVHSGFYNGFQYVKENLDEYMSQHWSSDKEIIITGHSLGGAIATLTAAYICDNYNSTKVMLYTFGSPRVGDRTFANYYTKKLVYFRIVNDNDLVTMVPLPGMDLKPHLIPFTGGISLLPSILDFDGDLYTHAGKLVHIHKLTKKSTAISPGYEKSTYALLALNPAVLAGKITLDGLLKTIESITDHLMGSYFPILEHDLKKTITAYLDKEHNDLGEDREGIRALEEEIRKLNEKKSDILENGDHVTKNYEASKIDVVIAHKNKELDNLKMWVQRNEENNKNKQYLLRKLIGASSNKAIEIEFEYHSEI